jgi:hypothetical protein
MAAPMVTSRRTEPVIILHTEPLLTALMAVAEALAEALAEDSVEDSAGASAEEDDGGKPENPALNVGSLGALRIQGC